MRCPLGTPEFRPQSPDKSSSMLPVGTAGKSADKFLREWLAQVRYCLPASIYVNQFLNLLVFPKRAKTARPPPSHNWCIRSELL